MLKITCHEGIPHSGAAGLLLTSSSLNAQPGLLCIILVRITIKLAGEGINLYNYMEICMHSYLYTCSNVGALPPAVTATQSKRIPSQLQLPANINMCQVCCQAPTWCTIWIESTTIEGGQLLWEVLHTMGA